MKLYLYFLIRPHGTVLRNMNKFMSIHLALLEYFFNSEGAQEMQIKFYNDLVTVTLIYRSKTQVLTNRSKAE